MSLVDVVIPARNEGGLLPATLRSLATVPAGADFTLTVVDDGSNPPVGPLAAAGPPVRVLRTAGQGAAAARNLGAAAGSAPVICFCDAHLAFTPSWLGLLVEALGRGFDAICPGIAAADRPAARGYGFTWGARYEVRWLPRPAGLDEVPFLPGGCLCLRRSAFQAIGGFDGQLVPWGHEDAEISLALWLTGARCGVEPAALVAHHFRRRHPYLVMPRDISRNLLRVGALHFGAARLRRLADHLGADAGLLAAVRAAALPRRALLQARRRRDDEWLCTRFHIPV